MRHFPLRQFSLFLLLICLPTVAAAQETPSTLILKNQSDGAVEVFWLNGGKEISYGVIEGGKRGEFGTFPGHRWIVRDAKTRVVLGQVSAPRGRFDVTIASPPDQTKVGVELTNNTRLSVECFWIGPMGREISYGIVKPGTTLNFTTYKDHKWVFRDQTTGKELRRFTAQKAANSVVLGAPPDVDPLPVAKLKVPSLMGLSRTQADAALLNLGLAARGSEGDETSDPKLVGRVYQQDPAADVQLAAGSPVAFKVYKAASIVVKKGPAPIDAKSGNRLPTIVPFANANDSVHIAWLRADGKIVVSAFSGAQWQDAFHLEIKNALPLLAGFTRDDKSNSYLLTTTKELARKGDWDQGYRSNKVQLLKLVPGNPTPEVFADLNSAAYSDIKMFSPLYETNNNTGNAQLLHGGGVLTAMLVHNHAWDDSLRNLPEEKADGGGFHQKGTWLALGTDKKSLYSSGGPWEHCADLRLLFDGKNILAANVWHATGQGVALSRLTPGTAKMSWSELRHVVSLGETQRTRLAGLAKTSKGYLLAYASGEGFFWDHQDWEQPDKLDLFATTVPANFAAGPAWKSTAIPDAIKTHKLVTYSDLGKFTARRAKLVDMKNGKYVLVWEQWTVNQWLGVGVYTPTWGSFNSTWALVLDENGTVTAGPTALGNARIQAGSEAVFLPTSRKAAWVQGDAANHQIVLHTLDSSLKLQSYPLNLP